MKIDKAFKELDIVIEKGGKEYNEALRKLDEVLAKVIKSETNKLTKQS